MTNLVIYNQDNTNKLSQIVKNFPNIDEYIQKDLETIGNSKIEDKKSLLEFLDAFYKSRIEKLVGEENRDNLDILEKYWVLKSFGLSLEEKDLKESKTISENNTPFIKFFIRNKNRLDNNFKLNIKNEYLDNQKKNDQNILEQEVKEILENFSFENIDKLKNLLIVGEKLQLGDNFRIDFTKALNESIKQEENKINNEIQIIKGKNIEINGNKKSLQVEIQISEQKFKLINDLLGKKIIEQDIVNIIKIALNIKENQDINNNIKKELLDFIEKFKKDLFEKYYSENQKIFSLNREKERKNLEKMFEEKLKKNFQELLNFISDDINDLKIGLVRIILITIENYKNQLDVDGLTRNYKELVDSETENNQKIGKLQEKIKNIQLKKAYKNEILEKKVISIKKDLENFYENGYKLDNNKKLEKIEKLLKQLEEIEEIKNLNFYKINKQNLEELKKNIQVQKIIEELKKEEDIFKSLEILENLANKEIKNEIKNEIKKYIENEAKIVFLEELYKGNFDNLDKFKIFFEEKKIEEIKKYFKNINEKVEKLRNNELNFGEIEELKNNDFEILNDFGENVKQVFVYELNKVINSIIKENLNNLLKNSKDKDFKVKIQEIINGTNSGEILEKIKEFFKEIYQIENFGEYNFSYLEEETYINYKNFEITKAEPEYYDEEIYKKYYEYYFNLASTKLKFANLGIKEIHFANSYSIYTEDKTLTINSSDKKLIFIKKIISLLENINNFNFEIGILSEINEKNIEKINNFLNNFNEEEYKELKVKKIILTNYDKIGETTYIKI